MSFRIRYTATAEADLERQLLWLKERSPQGAETWVNGIIQAVESLRENPGSQALALEGQRFGREIYQLLHGKRPRGKYRILYVIEGQEVLILTIRHGMRQLLDEETIVSMQTE